MVSSEWGVGISYFSHLSVPELAEGNKWIDSFFHEAALARPRGKIKKIYSSPFDMVRHIRLRSVQRLAHHKCSGTDLVKHRVITLLLSYPLTVLPSYCLTLSQLFSLL